MQKSHHYDQVIFKGLGHNMGHPSWGVRLALLTLLLKLSFEYKVLPKAQ